MTIYLADHDRDVPDSEDIDAMADLLRARFGVIARGVAEFFAYEHEQAQDPARQHAWAAVADRLGGGKPSRH